MDHIDHVVVRAYVFTGNVVTKSEKSRNKYLDIGNNRNISKHTKFANYHRFLKDPSFHLYSVALKSLIRQNFAHGTERQHCPIIPTRVLFFAIFFIFHEFIHCNNEIWPKSIIDTCSSKLASFKKDMI